MIITNKYGLPSSIMNALHRPTYSKGNANMSVTELMSSPRIVQLKRRHWNDLEEDASSMVWSLFGTAIHHVLEHGKGDNHIIEQRLFAEDGNVTISDYKTTGAWAAQNGKDDWEKQLNVYAYLVEATKKVPVKKLQIVAIIRDWSSREASYKEGYPKAPIVVIDIPLWTMEQRLNYIKDRITKHSDANFAHETDEELPECTSSEMWEKSTSYALIKKGNVRAKAVYMTIADAEKGKTELKDADKYEIQTRPGERTRCAGFCQVSRFCSQYQRYLDESVSQPDSSTGS